MKYFELIIEVTDQNLGLFDGIDPQFYEVASIDGRMFIKMLVPERVKN